MVRIFFIIKLSLVIDIYVVKFEFAGGITERLEAFEKMLSDIRKQSDYEVFQLEKLKAVGKEKSATYRQYFGNHMVYKMILEKYKEYGLID